MDTNTINPLIIQKYKKCNLIAICVSRMALSLVILVLAVMKHRKEIDLIICILLCGYGLLFSSLGLNALYKEHYYWAKTYGMLSLMDAIVLLMLTFAISEILSIAVIVVIAGLTSYTAFSYAKYLRNSPRNFVQMTTNSEEDHVHTNTGVTQQE